MANRKVSLYEHVKRGDKWTFLPVQKPVQKPGGKGMYLKDDRAGAFYISWYEGEKKRFQKCPDNQLRNALSQLEMKRHYLLTVAKGMDVVDPTVESARLPLSLAVEEYFRQMTGRPTTKALYRQNLNEYLVWSSRTYVDEIDKPELLRYKESLVKNGNSPLTASWKLLRINKFIKTMLKLKAGEGPIKKSDVREDLDDNDDIPPEIYEPEELTKFFAACNPAQSLLYTTFLKSAFRKQEIMFLEWTDIDPKRRTLRVIRKDQYGFRPKNGKPRTVVIPQDLLDRLLSAKIGSRHKLVFPTRTGKPNTKMLEACQAIATRAGMKSDRWWLHKFRSTRATEWLRKGIDIATVRDLLGHKDYKSVERYLKHLRTDELVASGKLDD
jgi:integrase/recombinase XerD